MALGISYSGNLNLEMLLGVAFSTDAGGSKTARRVIEIAFAAAGGDAPTISGWVNGTVSLSAATDLLLAHATDPFQGIGDSGYSDGFTPAGAKIKAVIIRASTANTGTVKIERSTLNGAPLFDTANDSVTLQAGGLFVLTFPTGTAALTTGTNDALTLTPSTGTQAADITIIYGP